MLRSSRSSQYRDSCGSNASSGRATATAHGDMRLTEQAMMAQLPGQRPKGQPLLHWRVTVLAKNVERVSLAGTWQRVGGYRSAWHAAACWEKVHLRALPRAQA